VAVNVVWDHGRQCYAERNPVVTRPGRAS
jgi:hypothetical protein